MKKIISTIIMSFLIIGIFIGNVNAATTSIGASFNKSEQTVSVTVSFSEKVSAAQFILNYDSNKVTYLSNSAGGQFGETTKRFAYANATPNLGSVTFKFKSKTTGNCGFSISSLTVRTANGKTSPTLSNSSTSINMQKDTQTQPSTPSTNPNPQTPSTSQTTNTKKPTQTNKNTGTTKKTTTTKKSTSKTKNTNQEQPTEEQEETPEEEQQEENEEEIDDEEEQKEENYKEYEYTNEQEENIINDQTMEAGIEEKLNSITRINLIFRIVIIILVVVIVILLIAFLVKSKKTR